MLRVLCSLSRADPGEEPSHSADSKLRVAWFVELLSTEQHILSPLQRQIVAASYVVAVMRQASERLIEGHETAAKPNDWLRGLVQSARSDLFTLHVSAAGEFATDPLAEAEKLFKSLPAEAAGGDSRTIAADRCTAIRRLFNHKAAGELGRQTRARFDDELARRSACTPPASETEALGDLEDTDEVTVTCSPPAVPA